MKRRQNGTGKPQSRELQWHCWVWAGCTSTVSESARIQQSQGDGTGKPLRHTGSQLEREIRMPRTSWA